MDEKERPDFLLYEGTDETLLRDREEDRYPPREVTLPADREGEDA